MSHQIDIGAYSLIKQSRAGTCIARILSNTTIGNIRLSFVCPPNKLWLVQQLTAHNQNDGAPRISTFAIKDDANQIVSYLSNDGVAKLRVMVGDAKTYDGFGLTFIPGGWELENMWFDLDTVGSVFFYAHITEIELT